MSADAPPVDEFLQDMLGAAAQRTGGSPRNVFNQSRLGRRAPDADAGTPAAVSSGFAQDEDEEEEEEEAIFDEAALAALMNDGTADMQDPYMSAEESSEDGEQCVVEAKPRDKRPRKTARRAVVLKWSRVGTYASEVEKDAKLEQLANAECGGGLWGNGKPGKGWKARKDKESGRRQRVRVRNCCFATESRCEARVRELQFLDGNEEWQIERYEAPHADHSISRRAKGVALKTKLALSSPSKMALSNKDALEAVRRDEGALDERGVRAIRQVRKRIKKKEQHQIVPAEAAGTFGGVKIFTDSHSKAALEAQGTLKLHTPFVCGEPLIDAESQTLAIAFSTRNLLGNAYRQQQYGLPAIMQVDTTYRIVLEGHNNMLFGTVDAAQHFHIIGYGICSQEDSSAHTHIMRCLAREAELLVSEHRLRQEGI